LTIFNVCTQEVISRFDLSGFKVEVIPSETFSYQVFSPDSTNISKEIKEGTLHLQVLDQTGKVPKGHIKIYADNIESLYIHNCILQMESTAMYKKLTLDMAASSGELKVSSDSLFLSLAAGSSLKAEGRALYSELNVGAGSNLNASKFRVEKGDIDIRGHSSAAVNIKKIEKQYMENGNLKNKYNKE